MRKTMKKNPISITQHACNLYPNPWPSTNVGPNSVDYYYEEIMAPRVQAVTTLETALYYYARQDHIRKKQLPNA